MKITAFEYHDADGWTLERMKLAPFNLLVGVSGAGKTRIVQAIERVCAVALGTKDAEAARGAKFMIEFEHDARSYHWEAELEANGWLPREEGGGSPLVRNERLTQDGQLLVDRSATLFRFRNQDLPRLSRSKSAIATLKEDPAMTPVHAALARCVYRTLEQLPYHGTLTRGLLENYRLQYGSVEALGADLSHSLHDRAYLIQELFPESFAEIKAAFQDAFPSVLELRVYQVYIRDAGVPDPDGAFDTFITVMEEGVELGGPFAAIPFSRMSSGMQRYLSFLVHLSFAPEGTVVLIDEIESSFGINCLPAAMRFLLSRAPSLQLILTSHHPYIIEQIPPQHWRIVTRRGSRVQVLDANTIPALEESRSHLDRFTRLINLPEYEQGIRA